MRIYLYILSIATVFVSHPASASDTDTLRQRMIRSYVTVNQNDPAVLRRVDYIVRNTDGTDVVIRELPEGPNDSLTAHWMQTFAADSTWPDIDYRSQQRGAWPPAYHVQRISMIARSYTAPASPYYHSVALQKILHAALGKWFAMGLKCPNWWYNEIGGPRLLGSGLLMLDQELTPAERAQAVKYMKQARIGMTGQNRTWLAGNVLLRGLLERNDSLVQQARDVIVAEITVAPEGKEGIQPDRSFHQHGPQQQFGNYGLAYATGIVWWGRVFSGTRYALTPEQIRVMRGLVLDGMAKVIWAGTMDINSCGRQLFANTPEGKALAFGKVLLDMAVLDPECAPQYEALYRQLIRCSEPNQLTGYTHFRNSDMSVFRQPGWMVSLRMSSPRVVGAEIVNGENLLSLQMGDGAMLLYKNGREYRNITPVWDYAAIPGTTTNIPSDTCAPFRNGSYAEFRGGNDFAGGLALADSSGGLSAMILEKPDMNPIRKSWFFGPDMIICMGNETGDIDPTGYLQDTLDNGRLSKVRTTVEQCLRQGPVRVVMNTGKDLHFGAKEPVFAHAGNVLDMAMIQRVVWVEHAGVGYHFPIHNGWTSRIVTAGPQTGNWHRFATMYDTTTVTEDIFRITIECSRSRAYAYVVIPEVETVAPDQRVAAGYRRGPGQLPYELHQDSIVHAVEWYKTGIREAVFFAKGAIEFADGTRVEASAPCLVAIEGDILSVVDPTQKAAKIIVKISRSRHKAPTQSYTFDTRAARGETLRQSLIRSK